MGLDYRGNKPNRIGIAFALKGIRYAFITEWNMRMHLLAFILVVFAGFFFQISLIEWLVVLLVSGIVMISEMLNTAMEHLLDYLAPERHPTVGKIKDLTAGAVFIAALVAFIIGGLIFIPKLLEFLY